MTIRDALKLGKDRLSAVNVPDAYIDAQYLLSFVTGKERFSLFTDSDLFLSADKEEQFYRLLALRSERVPLQYLLGSTDFYGYTIRADSRALIPRPETETLCEVALSFLKHISSPKVLDLCTGSGAIAVVLKKEHPSAKVFASDLSEDALSLAKENAIENKADIIFRKGDLFTPFVAERFDLIVTNPPYIPSELCSSLQQEVLYEPIMALDGGTDGMHFFKKIAKEALPRLTENGALMVECASEQTQILSDLFLSSGFSETVIQNDLFGKPRIVQAFLVKRERSFHES